MTLGGRSLLKRRSFVSLAVSVNHGDSLWANKRFIRQRKGIICAFCNCRKGNNISAVAATQSDPSTALSLQSLETKFPSKKRWFDGY